jgi:hypothetical protein
MRIPTSYWHLGEKKDMHRSILSTQYLPSLCPILKSISRWHLKSSIKAVYFATTKNIKSYIESYIRLNYSLFSESLCAPHCLHLLLKPSPPLLPVHFTQSSLQTAAMLLVCSIHTVKSSTFSFHLFLVLPCPESQSLTRATPQVHQQQQTLIPPSPIATTLTSLPLSVHHCHYCSPLPLLFTTATAVHHCHCCSPLPLLFTTATAVHHCSSCTSGSGIQWSSSQ